MKRLLWAALVLVNFTYLGGAFAALPAEEILPAGTNDQTPRGSAGAFRPLPRAEILAQTELRSFSPRVSADTLSCGRKGERLAALRFRVLKRPALLGAVELTFGNGARQVLSLREHFDANSESDWLPLSRAGGPNPCVQRMTILGQNANLSPERATVQVFGLMQEARRPVQAARR